MHHFADLDLDDLTPKQMRKLLSGFARQKLSSEERKKVKEELDEEDSKENDDLVDLHEEKKGDSKPPKVTKDDLPRSFRLG
jgi:Asp-tRNA(Asn)/Glu-tRNA(Gln) amidotransferase B subunit